MTTSNKIVAHVIDSALFIPLECLHSQSDTITYVFKKDGAKIVKQEIIVGETNANDAVILGGLSESDKVYLSVPPGKEEDEINLLKQMDGKRKKQKEEEIKKEDKPAIVVPAAITNN